MAPPLNAGFDDTSKDMTKDSITDPKWQKTFPPCLEEKLDAKRFMVRAMFVAFSHYLKHRKILDQKCFATNHICDKIKASTLNFADKDAAPISQMIRNAGEAITEGYLEEFALVISEKEHDEKALEVFSFKIHYDQNGIPSAEMTTGNQKLHEVARMEYEGTESVRRQLVKVVQCIQIICVKVLKPLPDDYSVNFRVSYTPITPASYRIQGFADHSLFYKAHPECKNLVLGALRPNHIGSLLECNSIYIDSVEQAEKLIRFHGDKLANKMGFAANDTLHATFGSDSAVANKTPNSESPAPIQVEKTLTSPAEVAEAMTAALVIESPSPERRVTKSQTKKTAEVQKPSRRGPYARVRSARRSSQQTP